MRNSAPELNAGALVLSMDLVPDTAIQESGHNASAACNEALFPGTGDAVLHVLLTSQFSFLARFRVTKSHVFPHGFYSSSDLS